MKSTFLLTLVPLLALAAAQEEAPAETGEPAADAGSGDDAGTGAGADESSATPTGDCSALVSSLYANFPTPDPVGPFHNITSRYYEEEPTRTRDPDGPPDCAFTEVLPSKMVYPVVDYIKLVEDWSALPETQDLFDAAREAECDAVGGADAESPPGCVDETMEWLREVAGVGNDTIQDLVSGADGRGRASVVGAAALAGLAAGLAYMA